MLIQHLRDRSEGIFAKVLVGLIIVVFALFGFGSITTFLVPVPKVAVVNGDEITRQEMELAVERNRQYLLSQNSDPLDIDEDLLRQNTLQSLINRMLMSQVVQDMNLQYSEALLDQDILGNPVFQTGGVFDSEQFQAALNRAGFTPVSYREEMRRDMTLRQLSAAIEESAFVTPDVVTRFGSLAGQTRDIAWLRIDLESLLPEVEVPEEALLEHYEANLKDFETRETVDIGYVEIRVEDFLDEVDILEAELKSWFDERRDSYNLPESRQVAHILVASNSSENGQDDDGEQEAAEQEARDIYQQILEGGDFAELAKEHSDDPGSAANGGDLGFSERGAFVKEFEEVAFSLEVGQVSEPVLSEFGYHIIKLLELEEGLEPELEDVREEVETAYRESLAGDLFISQSNLLRELAFEAADLNEPAEDIGLEIKSTGHVGRDASVGITANAEVMDAVFSNDLLLDGNNSDVIEISADHHVVVRVNAFEPSRLEPFDEKKDVIREIIRGEKAGELAEERAWEIVEMLESGSLTRYVADQFGLEWQVVSAAERNQPEMEFGIRDHAFTLPRPAEGDKSIGYTKLPGGDVAIISVTNVVNESEENLIPAEMDSLSHLLASELGKMDFLEFQETQLETSEIERLE